VKLYNTEYSGIPRNFSQFRMDYGIDGSKKNRRNSVSTEFRGHPSHTHPLSLFLPSHKFAMGQIHSPYFKFTQYVLHRVDIFTRDETGLVCLSTQLEFTLQLYW
jgi:hypothetical protein